MNLEPLWLNGYDIKLMDKKNLLRQVPLLFHLLAHGIA